MTRQSLGTILRHLALFFAAASMVATGETLDIYWIDVEGGAATLMVTPEGETVLMDAGYPGNQGRDAQRIAAVIRNEAGAEHLDYFLTSHFHLDHSGGLNELAELVPIERFVDHGDSVERHQPRGKELWQQYVKVAGGRRLTIKPGDRLPLDGAELRFIAARSKFIHPPEGAEPNPHCRKAELKESDVGENGKSVGFLLRFGEFEFLDLGDLTWNFEHQLACPVNRIGEVDLYQVTHHGLPSSGAPQLLWAVKPTVAVMNNGPRKGGQLETFKRLRASPGLQGLWQLHRAVEHEQNNDERMIANLRETEDCQGHWIKASVQRDGTYTVTNGRNGFAKSYRAKP